VCNQEVFEFQDHKGRKVVASFDGGHLSSDAGGALLFRELELRTGTIRRLAGCFHDERDARLIEHSVEELLRQRIGALSMGYEDLNDHDSLRYDPAHGLMAGKEDVEGLERGRENQGKSLAGHSTLNRLEQSALGGDRGGASAALHRVRLPHSGQLEPEASCGRESRNPNQGPEPPLHRDQL